jgi:hypothetical protein
MQQAIAVIDPVRHGFRLESLASPELTVLNQLKNRYIPDRTQQLPPKGTLRLTNFIKKGGSGPPFLMFAIAVYSTPSILSSTS